MAEITVGNVPAPAASEKPAQAPQDPHRALAQSKRDRVARATSGLAARWAEQAKNDRSDAAEAKSDSGKHLPESEAKAEAKPEAEKPAEKPAEVKAETKPETKEEPADEQTKRGLAQVERAQKKFNEERAAARAEDERRSSELVRRENELKAKATSYGELKKLRPMEVLDRLELSDSEFEAIAREAYARTQKGKNEPGAREAADQARRNLKAKEYEDQIAELRQELESVKGEFKTRDDRAAAEKWIDAAVKSGSAGEAPTLFKNLQAKNPDKARQKVTQIAYELYKANGEVDPTHSEVMAEFEKRQRAELEELGIDVKALLTPAKPAETKPATPAATATKTLDVTATKAVRPGDEPKSRKEKLASTIAGLKQRRLNTADQH